MKSVVVGAGRIGCGLVGEALRSSGHEVVFIVRSRTLMDHLNRIGGYRIRLVDGQDVRESFVDGIRAICVADRARVVGELDAADLVAICVQPHELPGVAPLIAAGLRRRSSPTNVLNFQNRVDAGPVMRRMVAGRSGADWPRDKHGFSGALAARIVSHRIGSAMTDDPLTFVGDPTPGFIVDGHALRAEIPRISGMTVVDDYGAAVIQKLYMFSAGLAVAAYLGHLKGYHYIHTAMRDPEVRPAVSRSIAEGHRALEASYGSATVGGENSATEIIRRFDNPALGDLISRVGRDPQRKLGPRDRLVGAAMLAERVGIRPEMLALGTAAALCFEDPTDPSSVELQRRLRHYGIQHVLSSVCGLGPRAAFGRNVAELWTDIRSGGNGWNRPDCPPIAGERNRFDESSTTGRSLSR